nr:hypothetical protein [Tanacetum cinerariifolium]
INTPSGNRPAFSNYDDDDDDEDYTIAITLEEPDNSLSMGDEHLDTILATESDEVIKSSVKNLVQSQASPPDSELVSLEEVKDDILREKMLNIHFLVAKIESLNDNPTPDHVLKSPSLFPTPVEDNDSFLEKFDTSLSYSDNSLPEFETFSDHTEETSSGSTTNLADYSLPKYDSFLFEIEPDQEKNSGSTTIHDDISLLYLECFYFKIESDLGELTSINDYEISKNVLSATNVNLSLEDDQSRLFTYVVWIFLSFLKYLVVPPYLLSSRNEDTIFDPDISNYYFSSLEPGVSHRSGTFMKVNVYQNHLNESPMEILSSTCSPMDQ